MLKINYNHLININFANIFKLSTKKKLVIRIEGDAPENAKNGVLDVQQPAAGEKNGVFTLKIITKKAPP